MESFALDFFCDLIFSWKCLSIIFHECFFFLYYILWGLFSTLTCSVQFLITLYVQTLIIRVLCSFGRIGSLSMTSSYEILSLYVFLFPKYFSLMLCKYECCSIIECSSCKPFFLNLLIFLNIFFLLSFYLEYKTCAKTVLVDIIRFWIMFDKARNHFRLSSDHVFKNWLFRKITYWVIQKWIISAVHFCSCSSKRKLIFL